MKKALFTLLCVLGLASCAQAQKHKEEKAAKAVQVILLFGDL